MAGYTISPANALPGFRANAITNEKITDATALLLWGWVQSGDYFFPSVQYQVDLSDFAAMEQTQQTALTMGEVIRIIDQVLGFDTYARVTELRKNLSDPSDISITISNAPRRIEDLITDIVEAVEDAKDNQTKELPADAIILDSSVEPYTTLDDWQAVNPTDSSKKTDKINGDKIDPSTLDRVCLAKVTANQSGATQLYKVKVLSLKDKKETSEEISNVIVGNESDDSLEVGQVVCVMIPSAAKVKAGDHPFVISGSGGSGGSSGRGFFLTSSPFLTPEL